jgi:hypothetical protein
MTRLRLTVVDIEIDCPYRHKNHTCTKENCDHGNPFIHKLGTCYVNSARKGHYCASPEGTGRCPAAMKKARRLGWRSTRMLPRPEQAREVYLRKNGQVRIGTRLETFELPAQAQKAAPHPVDHPVIHIVYSPLDTEGKRWMAVNALSGERKAVDMRRPNRTVDGAYLEWPWLGWHDADAYYGAVPCSACLHPEGCARHGAGKAEPAYLGSEAEMSRYLSAEALKRELERRKASPKPAVEVNLTISQALARNHNTKEASAPSRKEAQPKRVHVITTAQLLSQAALRASKQ